MRHTAAVAAIDAGDPAGAERAEQLWLLVEELHEQDLSAYHAAYAQAVDAELVERGVTVAFQLRRTTITDPVSDPVSEVVDEGWLADRLHEVARERTPLPATGRPPDWTPGATVAAVTAAGRSYLDRAIPPTRDGGGR